ncbi:MAG: amino acid adenylation domain-containing protein [Actinocatenispora sp.]
MDLEGIEDVYELSPIQEGLLFHNLYSPGSGVYLEQVTMRMQGQLDVPAYLRAWQSIVDRHAVLRTSFHWEGVDRALQVVHRQAEFPIEVLDWRDVEGDKLTERYEEFARADRMSGFDWAVAPLMRGKLIQLRDDEWEFFWSFSHLLMDGWSFGLAFAELADLYTGYAAGKEVELPDARPYRDYLVWWKRQDRTATEQFWREYLAGHDSSDALEIGSAPDGPLPEDEPTHAVLPTPELLDLMEPLTEFARGHGLTLNTVMQGSWALIVSRYLGREDVLIGSTGTQRPATLSGAERIMGPMLATTPVRAQVRPDAELVPWLRDLQTGMAQSREHADISLPELRRLADLTANRPLFEVDLAFENVPVPDMDLHGVSITGSTYDGRPHFPITMIVMPGEAMPEPRVVYDQTRFSTSSVRRLVDQFAATLRFLAANPRTRLGDIQIMPAEERQRVLHDWNGTEAQPDGPSLHGMLAERAASHPDRTAVVCGDESLSYAELTARANRVAHHLRGLGVAPGDRVALCLQRSVDMIVAIVGTVAAGAVYVPLDLGQPTGRMRHIVSDAGAKVMLTHGAVAGSTPEFDGAVVDLDGDADAIAAHPAEAPAVDVDRHDVAYMIYTSGSTGAPKGVLVTHANVLRLVSGAGTLFDFSSDDVWSMFHSYAFDVSVFEMWGALYHAARLVVVPHEAVRNPDVFRNLLADSGVTVLSQTPSAFRSLATVALESEGKRMPLRYVVFAGEPLDVAALEPWFERYGDDEPELINMYGITETTVHSTFHRVRASELAGGIRSNIGRPLPDLRIYLLDESGRPVPPGMTGEIHVAGAGVTSGYHGLPELTAQRFLPDPFAGEAEQRMYRSGDLARWTDDGQLEFLGRNDHQVKVRGFRVELGEVEAALRSSDGVRDAVVRAREIAGDTRLIAWVVPTGEPPSAAEVRDAASRLLPEYMVPAHVLTLDEIPLTPNGKIDAAALPDFDGSRPDIDREYVAPRTSTEEAVAAVWREILAVDKVGVHDDFFALGGHSLLATRVVFKLRSVLGIEVPVRALFDRPTLESFSAAVISAGEASEQGTGGPKITRQPRVVQRV